MSASPRLLSNAEITAGLEGLDWQREGDELVRIAVREDFAAALAWVNRVGELAEARNHHPDIAISWNQVTLRLSTHSAGGLTELDLELARAIDDLPA
jgi:4a-hydroxytetrahydrobiopterin dehydratase